MTMYARYTGSRTNRFTPGEVYRVMDDNGKSFLVVDDKGWTQLQEWGFGLFVPSEQTRAHHKWYVVPDYQPNGTPATTAHVVDAAGQEVAFFERIADAEAAVAAVNGRMT